jgi:hypothetical protein
MSFAHNFAVRRAEGFQDRIRDRVWRLDRYLKSVASGYGAIFKLASRLSSLASLSLCILIGVLKNRKVVSRQGSIEVIAFAVTGSSVPLE